MSRGLLSLQKSCAARGQRTTFLPKPRVVTPRGTAGWDGGRGMLCDFSCLAELAPQRLVILLPARSSHGPVAQWIRHRPTEPGIAGSSPAGVIAAAARTCIPRDEAQRMRAAAPIARRWPGRPWRPCITANAKVPRSMDQGGLVRCALALFSGS